MTENVPQVLTRAELVKVLRDGGITETKLIEVLRDGLSAERVIQGIPEIDFKERRETVKLCLQLYGYLDSGVNIDMSNSQFAFLEKLPRELIARVSETVDVDVGVSDDE